MTVADVAPLASPRAASLAARYDAVRAHTESLCAPLETEDYVVSSMPDVSPTKWHLAHTSWFFETFVLAERDPTYRSPDARYAYLFNSYYVQAGERHCRAKRGLVTRPTVAEVFAYRAHVDDAMRALLARLDDGDPALNLIELGLHHEQQHQELLLMDIEHVFWMNPLRPAYAPVAAPRGQARVAPPMRWVGVDEGVYEIGHDGAGFAFDNERPRHRVFLDAFALASRLVTNGEWLRFVEDGGYRRPTLWLSAGWATVQERRWEAPLYWERDERAPNGWSEFTLGGTHALDLDAPACHVSYYEADAFARWAGHRLPNEAEWEVAAVDGRGLTQLYDSAWQWTRSAYAAYPGYRPPSGALGEYNGKWMCDQWVLRGASVATPSGHARRTYRNFFPSDARWQFAGVRLAADEARP
jgi:ergothioneine biosynthesis protein EgtB